MEKCIINKTSSKSCDLGTKCCTVTHNVIDSVIPSPGNKKELLMVPLYGLSSKGDTKTWQISIIEKEDGTALVVQKWGKLDGKLQENTKTIREGKNIGRANATTPFQQACSEAVSKFRKKAEQEGYSSNKEGIAEPELPMLAQTFDKSKHRIEYPAYVQRKYNGVRNFGKKLSKDSVRHTSRKGKLYVTMGHIEDDLLSIMGIEDIFDGEIYNHDMTFQEITAAVKKQREDSLKLEFHVYDFADPDMDFEERLKVLQEAFSKLPKDSQIKLVETIEVNSEEEVKELHDKWVAEGYEGVIIRNKKGGYSFKHRSHNLQKYKEFIDEEFEIVGGYEGKGTSFEGCVTFECKAANGRIFGCVPKGSMEYKRELWNDLPNLIGKLLTVRYQELSDDGVPIFPVGLAIRDYE